MWELTHSLPHLIPMIWIKFYEPVDASHTLAVASFALIDVSYYSAMASVQGNCDNEL